MLQPSGVTAAAPLLASREDEHLTGRVQAISLQPTNRLFTTYELVEGILLRMTAFDLCIAASVCRYWKEVIESSKALKQYAAKVRPTLAHLLGLRPSQMNCADAKTWHFIVKASHGRLLVARVGEYESMLFVPKRVPERLRLLDERHGRQVILSYEWNPAPDVLQWSWSRKRHTEIVICRTKGKFCLLKQYLEATFPILRDSSRTTNGRLGIRFPFYEWKEHVNIKSPPPMDNDLALFCTPVGTISPADDLSNFPLLSIMEDEDKT